MRNAVAGLAVMIGCGLAVGWQAREGPSATVSGPRALFGNPGRTGGSWAAEHALALAVAWPVLPIAVFLPLSVRRFRQLSY